MAREPEDELTFFQRHRAMVIAGAVVVLGIGAYFMFGGKGEPRKKSAPPMVMVAIPPPPPPPPPTPPPTPPPEPPPDNPKQPEFQPEDQPKVAPEPPPPEPAPAPLGTSIQGDGPADGFGLSGNGNGLIGGNGKGGNGNGSKWGWYAGQVQSRVTSALRNHKRTRTATLDIKVRIWADSSGHVTKATLSGSSGDAAVDRAIRDEILTGLQLDQAPPEGMPMPIVMHLVARRPN